MVDERSPHHPAEQPEKGKDGAVRALGLGVVTGACDDDPSAIGTYASAGASLGPSFLWTAPATFPMMYAVVYPEGRPIPGQPGRSALPHDCCFAIAATTWTSSVLDPRVQR